MRYCQSISSCSSRYEMWVVRCHCLVLFVLFRFCFMFLVRYLVGHTARKLCVFLSIVVHYTERKSKWIEKKNEDFNSIWVGVTSGCSYYSRSQSEVMSLGERYANLCILRGQIKPWPFGHQVCFPFWSMRSCRGRKGNSITSYAMVYDAV